MYGIIKDNRDPEDNLRCLNGEERHSFRKHGLPPDNIRIDLDGWLWRWVDGQWKIQTSSHFLGMMRVLAVDHGGQLQPKEEHCPWCGTELKVSLSFVADNLRGSDYIEINCPNCKKSWAKSADWIEEHCNL